MLFSFTVPAPCAHRRDSPRRRRSGNGIPHKHESVEARLRELKPHSFRHTHATRLIEAGAKPVDVAACLGHADTIITQNLYTHDTEDMQRENGAHLRRDCRQIVL